MKWSWSIYNMGLVALLTRKGSNNWFLCANFSSYLGVKWFGFGVVKFFRERNKGV